MEVSSIAERERGIARSAGGTGKLTQNVGRNESTEGKGSPIGPTRSSRAADLPVAGTPQISPASGLAPTPTEACPFISRRFAVSASAGPAVGAIGTRDSLGGFFVKPPRSRGEPSLESDGRWSSCRSVAMTATPSSAP